MFEKILKFVLVVVMLVGLCFTTINLISFKAEATVYWQKLEMGIDPVTGGTYIRCFDTGSGCVTVEQPAY